MLPAFIVRSLFVTISAIFQALLNLWARLGRETLFDFRKFLLEWLSFLSFVRTIFVIVQPVSLLHALYLLTNWLAWLLNVLKCRVIHLARITPEEARCNLTKCGFTTSHDESRALLRAHIEKLTKTEELYFWSHPKNINAFSLKLPVFSVFFATQWEKMVERPSGTVLPGRGWHL